MQISTPDGVLVRQRCLLACGSPLHILTSVFLLAAHLSVQDTKAIYSIIREFALQNEQYAIAQYQRNAQQSVNMQEKGRGEALEQFGFMNIEQRMATPIPKFADFGQDITAHEIIRLERLLLEFGQRDAPSSEASVTRPPLHRKRSQAYEVDT